MFFFIPDPADLAPGARRVRPSSQAVYSMDVAMF